jgi:hypothetical protein
MCLHLNTKKGQILESKRKDLKFKDSSTMKKNITISMKKIEFFSYPNIKSSRPYGFYRPEKRVPTACSQTRQVG